ncbi:MAG: hypothetical protein VX898_01870 [Candidatus Thermoplasmatota archaeon]|nr:hypothetical protein [Candidatus Thermoplasmatota archaeon]
MEEPQDVETQEIEKGYSRLQKIIIGFVAFVFVPLIFAFLLIPIYKDSEEDLENFGFFSYIFPGLFWAIILFFIWLKLSGKSIFGKD